MIDMGANIGLVTVTYVKLVGASGRGNNGRRTAWPASARVYQP